ERGDAGLEPGVFLAGAGGHVLDGVEFLAADEIRPAERLLHPFAHALPGLAGHPGERAGSGVGHLDEIGDQGILALHGSYLALVRDDGKALDREPMDRAGDVAAIEIAIEREELPVEHGRENDPREVRQEQHRGDASDLPEQRDGDHNEKDHRDDHVERQCHLMRPEEHRGPGQIDRQLDDEGGDGRAAPSRPPGGADQRESETHEGVEDGPDDAEGCRRREQRRPVEGGEPRALGSAAADQARRQPEQNDQRDQEQSPADKTGAQLRRGSETVHAGSERFARILATGGRTRNQPRCAAIRNSTLPSEPVIGLSTIPRTYQCSASSQERTSEQTRAWSAGSRTIPPLPTSSRRTSNCGLINAIRVQRGAARRNGTSSTLARPRKEASHTSQSQALSISWGVSARAFVCSSTVTRGY